MKVPAFQRSCFKRGNPHRKGERGVTMVFVALSMVALIAMAALSIDVVTLYLDREEAQRSADAAALAAARVISVSGITGTADPGADRTDWQAICGPTGTATQVAQQVAAQNAIGGVAPAIVNVSYSIAGSSTGNNDCSGLSKEFAINPTVIVKVQRTGLPTMFSRIWSRNSNTVSATAAAEVFNPSGSGDFALGGDPIPVVPRCVKPLIIPDEDPVTTHSGRRWVHHDNGKISTAGIYPAGIIGEQFILQNNCPGTNCSSMTSNPPGVVTPGSPGGAISYIPALISTIPPAVAVPPSCVNDDFQNAVSGCDVSTAYQCGTLNGANADLSQSYNAEISAGAQCLTNSPGNDSIDTTTFPFQIKAGGNNPIAPPNQVITSSNSIMTLPIYDDWNGSGSPQPLPTGANPQITIVGFLQVFVTAVDPANNGNLTVTVLNVAGCGNNASTTLSPSAGTSALPIRLITPQ